MNWPNTQLAEILVERKEKPPIAAIENGEIKIVEKIAFTEGKIKLRTTNETKTDMITILPGDLVVSGINAAKGAIAIHNDDGAKPIAATIHYSAYKPDTSRASIDFLWWLLRSNTFLDLLARFVPGGIKTELKAKRLLRVPIPLPPLEDQRRIVAKIETFANNINQAKEIRREIQSDAQSMLQSAFQQVIEGAEYYPVAEVAPIVRRKVEVEMDGEYPELGVRSFGKGTFHKPVLHGIDVGTKKLYSMEPGDLVFSNVFSWEGAIAVIRPEDGGRVGSHRFITCVPKPGVATAEFLRFYLLTDEGIEKIREASPGGAGRNRTLGLKKLEKIEVPLPEYNKQLWFDNLQIKVATIIQVQTDNRKELDALLPAILDKAFKGAL